MAESITIARPYAQAAFRFANARQALKPWSDMLELLAAIVSHHDMRNLIESPRMTEDRLAEVVIQVAGEHIDGNAANLVRVLADNHRLTLLPDIAALFEIQRRNAEGRVQAELISAFPVTAEQQEKITQGLRVRLGRDIELSCRVEPGLLGGAIIRAGDLVIDGSVRGKLERLGTALNH
jgi:F-type H+-transporting ATPase subunit delta